MPRRPQTRRRTRRTGRFVTDLVLCVVLAAIVGTVGVAFRSGSGPYKPQTATNPNRTAEQTAVQSANTTAGVPVTADPNASLQALVGSLAVAKGDYAIAVTEPDGRHASANGDKRYTAASTYKLFIAYAVFQQVDSGQLAWTDTVMPGLGAEACMREMIVASDNACPEVFGDLIGWQNIDDMMDNLGLRNTHVEFHDNTTTANDLALYLSKLSDGTLLNVADSDTLLSYMKQQIYREGIPAGTGVTVADKVGFLDTLLHDAGIVYGAKGPYVLVIMTDNSSWSDIANVAKQVHNYLEQ